MVRFNEGKALDAVIKVIEARAGGELASDGWSPDETQDNDATRRVEYVCTIDGKLFAFEHTGIEPFVGQIDNKIQNEKIWEPIRDQFDRCRNDGEYWELYVPSNAWRYVKSKKLRVVRSALANWVSENHQTVPAATYGDSSANTFMWICADNIPFKFSLRRWCFDQSSGNPNLLSNRFQIVSSFTADLETERAVRICKACDDKYPKLEVWRKSHGAKTVLILEHNDLEHTSAPLVYAALKTAEANRSDTPDEIYLVSILSEKIWFVNCLRREGTTYPDAREGSYRYNPEDLTQLTKR